MLLAHFMVIWEIKDNKLYQGYQMSHYPNLVLKKNTEYGLLITILYFCKTILKN
jgi:hypothetical protein